eukprot:scaffold39218_cov339-Skeletonema_dohrnii-CCMP3373.AAC.1
MTIWARLQKNNTSSKKPRPWDSSNAATNGMDDAVFRLDSMTPRFRSGTSDTNDGSSPALLDLIGGAETPTTGLLMSSIENAMMDDISLNVTCVDMHLHHCLTSWEEEQGGMLRWGLVGMQVDCPLLLNYPGVRIMDCHWRLHHDAL